MAAHISIDLLGRLAEAAGPALTLALDAPTPVATIIDRLTDAHPALAATLAETRLSFAIDEELTDSTAMIAPGQRLALFPPVSGG